MEIRAFTISFAKHKAAKTRNEEKELLQELKTLQRQLDLSFSKPVLEKLISVKEKLDKIIQVKTNMAALFAAKVIGMRWAKGIINIS